MLRRRGSVAKIYTPVSAKRALGSEGGIAKLAVLDGTGTLRTIPRLFCAWLTTRGHHDERHADLVPAANPAQTPAIAVISNLGGPEQLAQGGCKLSTVHKIQTKPAVILTLAPRILFWITRIAEFHLQQLPSLASTPARSRSTCLLQLELNRYPPARETSRTTSGL